jgi:putative tricarboxylic transport membrane protein
MIEGLIYGLQTALATQNLIWILIGCSAGTLIGMMPGLGPITAIALMIPVSYNLDPAGGLIMMAGVYYGAVFGGSTSAILINAPGVASTVATSFDGYKMTLNGQAGKALAVAAYSSFAGGVLSAIVLVFTASTIASFALYIQSPEYAALLLLAMSSIVVFAPPLKRIKSMITLLLGLMLGTVGTDQLAGVQRFTFGQLDLVDGIHFIVIVMATFALAEVFYLILKGKSSTPQIVGLDQLKINKKEIPILARVISRSSLLGFFIGILPGAGATLASLFAYDVEKRVGNKGLESGVAAPESANNAACTGSFVPLLSLGIPGSGTTAVLLGVMLAYGLQPGPSLITDQPQLFWGVIASMFIGNCILLILNLPLIPFLARLINIPYPILLPIVISLSFIGVFLTTFSVFDLGLLIGFAFFATILRVQDYPLAPLLLGFILSSMFEDNVRRTLLLSMGEWSYLSDRPVTIFLLMICLLIWSTPLWYRTKH